MKIVINENQYKRLAETSKSYELIAKIVNQAIGPYKTICDAAVEHVFIKEYPWGITINMYIRLNCGNELTSGLKSEIQSSIRRNMGLLGFDTDLVTVYINQELPKSREEDMSPAYEAWAMQMALSKQKNNS